MYVSTVTLVIVMTTIIIGVMVLLMITTVMIVASYSYHNQIFYDIAQVFRRVSQ